MEDTFDQAQRLMATIHKALKRLPGAVSYLEDSGRKQDATAVAQCALEVSRLETESFSLQSDLAAARARNVLLFQWFQIVIGAERAEKPEFLASAPARLSAQCAVSQEKADGLS